MDRDAFLDALVDYLNEENGIDGASRVEGEPTVGFTDDDGEIWFLTLSGE